MECVLNNECFDNSIPLHNLLSIVNRKNTLSLSPWELAPYPRLTLTPLWPPWCVCPEEENTKSPLEAKAQWVACLAVYISFSRRKDRLLEMPVELILTGNLSSLHLKKKSPKSGCALVDFLIVLLLFRFVLFFVNLAETRKKEFQLRKCLHYIVS